MGAWANKDLISIKDFSKDELLKVIDVAAEIEANKERYCNLLSGKILATLFFEPSTRTRLSFEAAMHRLGGGVIGFAEPEKTSIAKGESVEDTMRIISGYCDAIVIRHPDAGSARKAADASAVPVINAGDGANEHPTQTLVDLYTIMKTKGTLDNLRVGFVGDLKFGRTVHSLAFALSHFNSKLFFISPPSLKMPDEHLEELKRRGVEFVDEEELGKVSNDLDVLYMTRIQKERFLDAEDYAKVKGIYRLDKGFLKNTKPELKILHPLPRVDEINPELDGCEQSIYFEQAHNGVPVRQALLALILGKV
jgi:aspartate carbamoyltransferase catalytic subunit